ncbi:MAG: nucleotidyltransferase family protein [Betaproteobacteria bacterium]|nr:nucleotidyltransferase family protein [Betaproteobacteria bacterium]NCA15972.1 nucleotidyltransferase family protein [Betaproteobacteria bacterium]
MRVMILAAGRGERMRPLTDHTPKPLLRVGGKSLLEHHLTRLGKAGFSEVVINLAHLGGQIKDVVGSGERWNLRVRFSEEPPGALETAGGIATARPWTHPEEWFLVVNADIYTDFNFALAPQLARSLPRHAKAALVLVRNPDHHKSGDFLRPSLAEDAEPCILQTVRPSIQSAPEQPATSGTPLEALTYSGIGVYHPSLFADCVPHEARALGPLLRKASQEQRLFGARHGGIWVDVGTPERLRSLDQALA